MFLASPVDIIAVPFGYLMQVLYQLTANYGLSLLLFAVIVKLILLPATMKSKKSMMAMSRLAPLAKTIQDKYGDDKVKAQQALSDLYKSEGVSTSGGCLWSLLPLLLLFPLYAMVRQPMNYLLHLTADQITAIVGVVKEALPASFSKNTYYDQLVAAPHIHEFAAEIKAVLPDLDLTKIPVMNFNFLGINLGEIPQWKVWTWTGFSWNQIGGLLLVLLSAASGILSMFISQKMNNTVISDSNGERDEGAAQNASQSTTKMMMWLSPIMTLWIGFSMPAAMSLYWLVQGVVGVVIDVILTKHYRKGYDAEDAQLRAQAALKAAEEAERERIRAQRRAENPDGITENTSKKKMQRQQEQADAARRAAQKGESRPVPEQRPNSRGRNYDPDRYHTAQENKEE